MRLAADAALAHLGPAPSRSRAPQSPQVDDRLAGEGTGKILGINDPSQFWVIVGVFGAVWATYYVATRDVDGTENDDDFGARGAGVLGVDRCRSACGPPCRCISAQQRIARMHRMLACAGTDRRPGPRPPRAPAGLKL